MWPRVDSDICYFKSVGEFKLNISCGRKIQTSNVYIIPKTEKITSCQLLHKKNIATGNTKGTHLTCCLVLSSWRLTFSQLCWNNSNSASPKPQRLETDPRGLPPNQLGLLLLGMLTLVAAASR